MATYSSSSYGAKSYAAYRPQYTDRLRDLVLEYHQGGRDLALDVGTGTGQVAKLIAPVFKQIHATDASPVMLSSAIPIQNVVYATGAAERLDEADNSVDLIISATAAHWFNPPAFEAEVTRVLRPGGTVAVLGYVWMHILDHPRFKKAAQHFSLVRLGPYWDAGRTILDTFYDVYTFPGLADVMRRRWEDDVEDGGFMGLTPQTLTSLRAFLNTWSAYKNWKERHGEDDAADPVDELIDTIKADGIQEGDSFTMGWDQALIMARKPF